MSTTTSEGKGDWRLVNPNVEYRELGVNGSGWIDLYRGEQIVGSIYMADDEAANLEIAKFVVNAANAFLAKAEGRST